MDDDGTTGTDGTDDGAGDGDGTGDSGTSGDSGGSRSNLSDSERDRMQRELDTAKKRAQGLEQALKQDRRYLYEEEEVKQIRADHRKELKSQQEKHDQEIKSMTQHNNLRILVAAQDLDPDFAKLITNAEFNDDDTVKNEEAVVKALAEKLNISDRFVEGGVGGTDDADDQSGDQPNKEDKNAGQEGTQKKQTSQKEEVDEFASIGQVFKQVKS